MSLEDFDVKVEESIEPDQLDLSFERFYHNTLPYLKPAQTTQLLARIHTLGLTPLGSGSVEYGANYDITAEVEGLITAVRAMQNSVMTPEGRMRQDVTPREMKEVVTSTTSLMNLLMKSHEKLMTFDRQRRLEQSTVDILRLMGDADWAGKPGEEIVSEFVKMMEERLEED